MKTPNHAAVAGRLVKEKMPATMNSTPSTM